MNVNDFNNKLNDNTQVETNLKSTVLPIIMFEFFKLLSQDKNKISYDNIISILNSTKDSISGNLDIKHRVILDLLISFFASNKMITYKLAKKINSINFDIFKHIFNKLLIVIGNDIKNNVSNTNMNINLKKYMNVILKFISNK